MQLSPAALAAFTQDALTRYPNEACGLVIDAKYVACSNASKTPEADFYILATELLQASSSGEVQALLHSHPYDPANPPYKRAPEWPSHADMVGWINGSIPWGIAATDGHGLSQLLWLDDNTRPPLLKREFVHGVADCYALIRDYFLEEKGVHLKNFARGWDWWHSGDDLYAQNFEDAGFKVIKKEDAVVGDCVMYKIHSPVTNHAAVIVGPDTILHHYVRHASCLQKKSDYDRFATHYVRYQP